MRRAHLSCLLALAVVAGTTPAAGQPDAPIRDVGPLVRVRQHESSYAIAVADANADGWDDVLIVHHGSTPSELFLNQPHEGGTLGFEVALRLVDTLHWRPDRHGCIFGDPDVDGLQDILCLKGADQGRSDKWNELWMQGPEGTWTDRAAEWGVEDVWGRGRHPAWIDLNGDDLPDLFVGNDTPRRDRHGTPNRLYLNEGDRFREVDMGITREDGTNCVQVVDVNGDGLDDILLCGKEELILYVREQGRFVRANDAFGVPASPPATAARVRDVSGDGVLDLIVVRRHTFDVRLAGPDGAFGAPVVEAAAGRGHGLAVGDVDGDQDQDLYIVFGCVERLNAPDVLLLNGGDGREWTPATLPPLPDGEMAGCGDTAEMLDFDRDGAMDIVVLNGGGKSQPLDLDGPDQLLTLGSWEPLG